MKLVALVLGLLSASAMAYPLNPDVTPDTIKQTICVPGWTKTVRPPARETDKIKLQKLTEAGLTWAAANKYELDHKVPLTLGGAPREPGNLWLQLWPEARVKDKLEVRLKVLVCAGKMPLAAAQACIFNDWRACMESTK